MRFPPATSVNTVAASSNGLESRGFTPTQVTFAPSSAAFRTPCQSRNPTVLPSSSMYRIGPCGRGACSLPSMTDGLSTLYQDLLSGSYDCVDRIKAALIGALGTNSSRRSPDLSDDGVQLRRDPDHFT